VRRTWLILGLLLTALSVLSVDMAARAQSKIQIVALGASNTHGGGVAPEEAYPVALQRLLKEKGIDATFVNAGIPGDTTGGMLARLEGLLTPDTRVVILQPGTNDVRMGLGEQRVANIATIKERLEQRGIRLVLLEEDMLGTIPRSELRDDGIHFTPKGYTILAETILPGVLTALGR
jgi:acyl-CoA thioesterase I